MNKKKWSRPKLIVLARSNPEEMVLIGCKRTNATNAVINKKACFKSCVEWLPS